MAKLADLPYWGKEKKKTSTINKGLERLKLSGSFEDNFCDDYTLVKCRYCKSLRLRGSIYCLFHFVRNLANTHSIPKENTNDLVSKLYLQEFRCFYTGILLLPGINTSLDHVIPKTKNGTNDLTNLVWVDSSVNRMKSNIDLDEFLTRYSNIIEEYKLLSSLDSDIQNIKKLNYILRIGNIPETYL